MIFAKGISFCDFLFASYTDKTIPKLTEPFYKKGQFLLRICSEVQIVPLRVVSVEVGGKTKMTELFLLKLYPMDLKLALIQSL